MNIKLFGDRILVRRMPLPEQSIGDVYILGRDYPTMGTVLQVGSGQRIWNSGWCICGGFEFDTEHRWQSENWQATFISAEGMRLPITDILIGDIVQWSVGANFDLCQVSEDLFIFNYDQLNLVQRIKCDTCGEVATQIGQTKEVADYCDKHK